MSKIDDYIHTLSTQPDWDAYLLAESHLPGPRGNLELAKAASRAGNEEEFRRWRAYTPDRHPTNTPGEFVAFCGVLGLGELLSAGRRDVLPELRSFASDPRWRVREAVAMALQRWGLADPRALLAEMTAWAQGSSYDQRAVVAGLCEPALLETPEFTQATLNLLDVITANLPASPDRRAPGFISLRKALGYGWSVAVAALPEEGVPLLRKWQDSKNKDIAWVVKENLEKNRLKQLVEAGFFLN